jgi:hypothetical protein
MQRLGMTNLTFSPDIVHQRTIRAPLFLGSADQVEPVEVIV